MAVNKKRLGCLEHHRNPSGLHNKVNYFLSESKWDDENLDKLRRVILTNNASWENAFLIASLVIRRRFDLLHIHFPQYWYWIKEYINDIRKYKMEQKNVGRKDF